MGWHIVVNNFLVKPTNNPLLPHEGYVFGQVCLSVSKKTHNCCTDLEEIQITLSTAKIESSVLCPISHAILNVNCCLQGLCMNDYLMFVNSLGLSKKLDRLGKDKDCVKVKKWHRSIVNHLYWCAVGCGSGTEKVARWKSLLNHMQDIHVHSDPAFPKCLHPPKVSKKSGKWLKPGQFHKY